MNAHFQQHIYGAEAIEAAPERFAFFASRTILISLPLISSLSHDYQPRNESG